jgi:hypothetical protein
MAINFDNDLNARLRKEVRNFNKRRDRLERAGYRNLPAHQTVSELKSRYGLRRDLVREIERLKNFTRKDLEKKIGNMGEVKASSWQFDYLKVNQKAAKEYFQQEYERVHKKIGRFPGERTYLDTISAKLNLLNQDIRQMNQSDFRSAITAINEFAMSPTHRKEQYRGFLSEVEWVMEKTGISQEDRDKFFNKFSKLTPSQFLYAYDNNKIIEKVYSLYHKDYDDDEAYLTDEKNAESIIIDLMEQADIIVKDAQLNAD